MNKRTTLQVALIGIGIALILLLVYSFERTSWLFGLFEEWHIAAYAAAVVVEASAVALIAGAGALALMDEQVRAWANRALGAVLSIQALANLAAGYLRGGARTMALFDGGQGWQFWSGYAVAAVLWLVVNLSVPALILCLSKLLERLIHAYATLEEKPPATQPTRRLVLAQEQEQPTIERASVALDRACPGCNRALSAGQYGAAKRWGYCSECKAA